MRNRLRADARFRFVSPAYLTADHAASVIVLDHVVARFKDGVSSLQVDSIASSLGAHVVRAPVPDSGYKTYLISGDSTGGVLSVANAINISPLARWASPDMIGTESPSSVPTDPYFTRQYYLSNSLISNGVHDDINVEKAWDLTKGDSSLRIVFVGTGIDQQHPEYRTRTMVGFDALWNDPNNGIGEWAGHPAPDDGHGTAVAGIATALQDGSGTAGIAPNVQYDAVRIFRHLDIAAANDIANGITWAYQRSDIINNSWGGCGTPNAIIADAVANALAHGRGGKGTVVIFSAGNTDSRDGCTTTETWESELPGEIAVAALAKDGSHASYSLTGPDISVSAFGGELGSGPGCFDGEAGGADIVTTDLSFPHDCPNGPNGEYAYTTGFGGTSAAAPQVAGVVALILSRFPSLTAAQVKAVIQSTAVPWGDHSLFGFGKLDAFRAVANLAVTMSGVGFIDTPGLYTWTAHASGGNNSYSYQWQLSTDNGVHWTNVGTNSATYSDNIQSNGNFQLQVIVTSDGLSTTSAITFVTVQLGGCGPGGC
ncbi:MAG TPA: S8 family serine peptidase [Gemmatimonadaceae bacterium]|nr:S8 family serine peptidase [Gemmatimonadaceae bacterium]